MKQQRILIAGLKWIGDAIMSMPAVQACRAANPDAHITLLVPAYLKPLWEMHPVPDDIQCLEKMLPTIGKLRAGHYGKAYILPNSFRSAFMPLVAGIRPRIGLRGKWRRALLTRALPAVGGHQSNEYFPVLAPEADRNDFALPELAIPEEAFQAVETKLPGIGNFITLMPGAARGVSKMWPVKYFEELGTRLITEMNFNIVLAGGVADASACEELAGKLGDRAVSLAGKTSLKEWAALLSKSRAAVANDSGGMHLAAAVGTPVVGIYGITDPEKTGPLALRYRVLQNSSLRSREISRQSAAAADALSSITPGEVLQSVMELV
ncbi:MAG: lipopolysaccharide heptosyltransferase II [Kiritimatiellales bacterium]|nr:lipopolysaccharide heptosyltransferase II [Kiritimatiellales bacterium]